MAQDFTEHAVRGGGGVTLYVREWGNASGQPIVLIHGWSQSLLCWKLQYTSNLSNDFRIIAFDNRGHGQSEKPMVEEAYADDKMWADDLAVIEVLGLKKPLVTGWSYGGHIICDYVKRHGQSNLGAINFVAAVVLRTEDFRYFGPDLLELAPQMSSSQTELAIAATRKFLRACTHAQLPTEIWETALCFNMLTPPQVREWLNARILDFTDVLRALSVPTLVTIGMADRIVFPAMGEYILGQVQGALASRYDNVGHAPFVEDAPRFNRELRELARKLSD
jgi:pimeloyl-ACP methyl ester carboxylesterase